MPTTDQLEAEIDAARKIINELQIAVLNLASKTQLRQLTLLKQKDIDDILIRLAAIETRLAVLEAR